MNLINRDSQILMRLILPSCLVIRDRLIHRFLASLLSRKLIGNICHFILIIIWINLLSPQYLERIKIYNKLVISFCQKENHRIFLIGIFMIIWLDTLYVKAYDFLFFNTVSHVLYSFFFVYNLEYFLNSSYLVNPLVSFVVI